MKVVSKLFQLLAALLALALLVAGCGQSSTPAQSPSAESSTSASSAAPSETVNTAETVDFVDDAGRTVTIPGPTKLTKVFYPSPLGQALIYTIAPDRMAGLVAELNPGQQKYWPKAVDLPVVGNADGGAQPNYEAILAAGTQIYFQIGPMKVNETAASNADELQAQMKIPVVVLSGLYEDTAATYRKLGEIFGEQEKAEEMAAYCEKVIAETAAVVDAIPTDQRVRTYYAETPTGLMTEPETSSHAAVLKYAGAYNVADVEMKPGSGMSPVSLEQVIAWNPDVIVTVQGGNGAYQELTTNPDWASISAIANDKILVSPTAPFSWIDRPPSVQRFLGTQWLAKQLYPDKFDYELDQVVKQFYSLFYEIELSDADVEQLLATKG